MYKPNINLPLASSYNERGIAGYTNTITNRIDQQKINCIYEITKNAITGAGKLYLTKRPGVTVDGNSYGTSSQAAYQICQPPGTAPGTTPWVFSRNGNDVRVSDNANTTVIFSSASAYIPSFLDKTAISGTDTVVLQSFLAGGSSQKVHFSSALAIWTQITDADFTAFISTGKMEHMDGFAFILDSTNKIYNSDLNSLANWTATNFITKQIKQDFPKGLARLNNVILGFGVETVEAFYNAGNATGSPLLGIKQLHNRIGLVALSTDGTTANPGGTHYYSILQNKLYFVGRRSGGIASIGVFSFNGSGFEKVSTSGIDKILGERNGNIYSVNTIGFNGRMACAISLSAPTSSTQTWLMYFPDWNEWFEWNSTVFSPVNANEFFIGLSPNGQKVYKFAATDNWTDDNTLFTMSTQFRLPQDGHHRKRMAEFGVLADTSRTTDQLVVQFSDDDDQTFYTVGNIELMRDIKTLNRGGSYRQRTVRLSDTGALETRLSAFIARVE